MNKNFNIIYKGIGISKVYNYKLDNGLIITDFSKGEYYSNLIDKFIKHYLNKYKNEVENCPSVVSFGVDIYLGKNSNGLMGYIRKPRPGESEKYYIQFNIEVIKKKFKDKTNIKLKNYTLENFIKYIVLHEFCHILSLSYGSSEKDELYHGSMFQKFFLKYRSELTDTKFNGDSINTNFSIVEDKIICSD